MQFDAFGTATRWHKGALAWQCRREGSQKGSITALRQLLLLRHAKSLWDDPKLSDHARPLNVRGRTSARAMSVEMRRLGLIPDLVLVSSARRTLQTLEELGSWQNQPLVEPMDALYLASAHAMLDVLHDVADSVRCVLLIGHNPGMHELAMTLVGAQAFASVGFAAPASDANDAGMLSRLAEGYPTGALCEFSVAGPWSSLGEGSGQLQHFIAPRDLPEPQA